MLIIDVKEPKEKAGEWAAQWKFTFPVLLDFDGAAASRYAPPGVQPDLKRYEVPIGSNLIIDRDGKIRFNSLLDSTNFDARLIALTKRLDELLANAKQ